MWVGGGTEQLNPVGGITLKVRDGKIPLHEV